MGWAYLKPESDAMAAAINTATAVHFSGDKLIVGLGWHHSQSGFVWHNGATAGFSSMLMIDLAQDKVVAAMTNSSSKNNVEDIALHLLNPARSMRDHEFPVQISTEDLKAYLGGYEKADGASKITITVEGGLLFFSTKEIPAQALTYVGDDTFKLRLINAKLSFSRDKQANVTGLTFSTWGEPQRYRKTN